MGFRVQGLDLKGRARSWNRAIHGRVSPKGVLKRDTSNSFQAHVVVMGS